MFSLQKQNSRSDYFPPYIMFIKFIISAVFLFLSNQTGCWENNDKMHDEYLWSTVLTGEMCSLWNQKSTIAP